jgi:ParB family chromosome partitioning protein
VIPNPNQPRSVFDQASIDELAQSIRENSLLQPIVVEDAGDGTYILVGGERRLKAVQSLGWSDIPATIRERSNHGGRELLLHAVIENVQREDMSPIDEAAAYQRMHDEFGMTWVEISLKVGKSASRIGQVVVLLKYDEEIQEMIKSGKFSHQAEVARAVQRIPSKEARIGLAERAASKSMTGKQIIESAEKLELLLSGEKIELCGAKSPAMALVNRKHPNADEENAPSGWNALRQINRLPAWSTVVDATTRACNGCALVSMASRTTCGECPLVDFLERVINHV